MSLQFDQSPYLSLYMKLNMKTISIPDSSLKLFQVPQGQPQHATLFLPLWFVWLIYFSFTCSLCPHLLTSNLFALCPFEILLHH